MKGSSGMDHQLADLIWMIAAALRAGYPLDQVLAQLATETPQPAADLCACTAAGFELGLPFEQVFAHWQVDGSLSSLAQVGAVILASERGGAALADRLDPLGTAIYAQHGSDGALYPAMRSLAQAVGAALPPRVGKAPRDQLVGLCKDRQTFQQISLRNGGGGCRLYSDPLCGAGLPLVWDGGRLDWRLCLWGCSGSISRCSCPPTMALSGGRCCCPFMALA